MLWCIAQDRLPELQSRIRARQRGEPPPVRLRNVLPPPAKRLADFSTGRPTTNGVPQNGGVAVLYIRGILEWSASFCFADTIDLSVFANDFKQAVDDARVTQIVLWINSPGGCILGVAETAEQIFAARAVKPITAFVEGIAASAGYWLASAASRVVAMPSAEVGSIGVYSLLLDESGAFKKDGIGVNIFKAPPLKTAFSGLEPIPDEGKVHEQGRVNDAYQRFLKAVASYRGKAPAAVEKDFGAGMTIEARQGLRVGAVDELAMPDTFAATLISGEQTRMAKLAANAGLRAQLQRKTAITIRSCREFGRRGRRHHA